MRAKACGLNCVETYVPWNLHEEVKGEFNFDGILDVRKFVQLAHEVGLYVLFRPGPYICSEWDFGGLPSWLLSDREMKVRSAYQPYLDAVDSFFSQLLAQVADLQWSNGGPIIAVQIENEYGSYGNDLNYKIFLKQNMEKYGIKELFFTSDNGTGIQQGNVPGALITANFQEQEHGYLMYEYLKNLKQPDGPLMVMEFWTGWFDHWGEKHHVWPIQEFEKVLNWIFDQDSSVNFYMFHGGTNFGFMAGANEGLGATNEGGASEPYAADVTSYDYDSPVAENGDLMPKWFKIKEMILKRFPEQAKNLPDPPAPIESATYGEVSMNQYMSYADVLSYVKSIRSSSVLPMECLDINNGGGQGYGMTVYRTALTGTGSNLQFKGRIKDRATILIDGKQAGVLEWLEENPSLKIDYAKESGQLDVIVENLGRVNYADFESPVLNDQRKGLREPVLRDGTKLDNWEIFPLEFKSDFLKSISSSDKWQADKFSVDSPGFYRGTLKVEGPPKDTFVHLEGWNKGLVFVNGFNLGRYWERGPQKTLYLPGPILKEGDNEVLIFEQHRGSSSVNFVKRAELGETVNHKTVIPDVVFPTE